MKILAFIREKKFKKTSTEPIIIFDSEDKFHWRKVLVVLLVVSTTTTAMFKQNSGTQTSIEHIPYYTICYEREDIKYYDRELDKVFIKGGYDYCEQYPQQSTGQTLEGSCVDHECQFPDTPQSLDKEFNEKVGTRFFIRY